ncbi:MAG TPA: metallophosphoesterase [Clostridia bacterium]|jgi:predicted phosphohydrolase|nr:metallophosphoesterase [Clostridia bacterium]
MQIYAIADLHLSLTSEKPMDVFGETWRGHAEKLERNWRECVQEDDLVLIPGDISWAMQLSAALPDLSFIGNLPGKKILLKGNHDYWWSAIGRVRSQLPAGMRAIQNDSIVEGGVGLCGTRGWLCPGSNNFSAEDQKIYLRELDRLTLSLNSLPPVETKIAMLHFPPFADKEKGSGFTERLEAAGVQIAIYGHLHGEANRYAFEGERNGITYHCVAADKLDFAPKLIYG